MEAVMIVLGVIFSWYPLYLLRNAWWLNRIPVLDKDETASLPTISVIIPARNAGLEIGRLMESLVNQQYPPDKWECIVVDDGSSDNTVHIVQGYTGRIPHLSLLTAPPCEGPAFKKNAIAEGIRNASGTWILTTDADCIVSPGWLTSMARRMLPGTVLVSGPVELETGGSVFGLFQQLEFAGLIGIGAANIQASTPNLCNGANLAYQRDAFFAVGGFSGVDSVASGDDELLMHRIFMQGLGNIVFAMDREALVCTPAQDGITAFARQRIRWVSKGRRYERKSVTYILMASYLSILALFLATLGLIWSPSAWPWVLGAWLVKAFAETLVITPVLRISGKHRNLLWIIPEQPFHVVYVLWAGIAGSFAREYEWKGRRVK